MQKPNVVVIGAGVIGLTTALKIQETGKYDVQIIAEHFHTDMKGIHYTSSWAGANHLSVALSDVRQQKLDKETFDVLWEMSAPSSPTEGLFMRITQTENYIDDNRPRTSYEQMPNFKPLPASASAPGGAVTFSTLTIDTPVYIEYLVARFQAGGGSITRGTVQHISHIESDSQTSTRLNAIIVCAGLGARTLGGVEDRDMYPIRGQTVLLRAPWVKSGMTSYGLDGFSYIIPRRSGESLQLCNVIIGGTFDADDWHPTPRPETTLDILTRAIVVAPHLAPPGTPSPTVNDLLPLVIEEGCGLRPARRGGIRLDVGSIARSNGEGEIPVVFNYGHAGYGYQSSWGSASSAVDLLESAMNKTSSDKPCSRA